MNQISDLRRVLAEEVARLQAPADLESRVLALARPVSQSRPIRTASGGRAIGLSTQALRLVGGLLLVAILISALVLGRLVREANIPSNPYALSSAEEAQLAELEARPLLLTAMPADGVCPTGPYSDIRPWLAGSVREREFRTLHVDGTGPVYRANGPAVDAIRGQYWDMTYFTEPTFSGLVLVRGAQLDGRYPVVFVGPYGVGRAVGTDVIQGKQVDLYQELVLRTSHAAASDPNYPLAPGWHMWKVRQGGESTDCAGLQFDTLTGTEVVGVGPAPRS